MLPAAPSCEMLDCSLQLYNAPGGAPQCDWLETVRAFWFSYLTTTVAFGEQVRAAKAMQSSSRGIQYYCKAR